MDKLIKAMFPNLEGVWKEMNLNDYTESLKKDSRGTFNEWVISYDADYLWGGWMEDREVVLADTYLPSGGRIHLGVDYWVPEGEVVHLPTDGKLVYSRHDPDQDGGWGGKVIFDINGIYHIFGHLKDLADQVGQVYPKGAKIGVVAPFESNGGWHPHLHLQCMRTLNVNVDGYSKRYDGMEHDFPNPGEIWK